MLAVHAAAGGLTGIWPVTAERSPLLNPSKLATLLSRVKDGDGAAFEELYRCYFHRVFAVALSILKK